MKVAVPRTRGKDHRPLRQGCGLAANPVGGSDSTRIRPEATVVHDAKSSRYYRFLSSMRLVGETTGRNLQRWCDSPMDG